MLIPDSSPRFTARRAIALIAVYAMLITGLLLA